ncbi:hypothetical protein AMAG_13586 [Allomyces macrogynus ATCC 38327]|uniref:Uncharacterized protein n=1 Tax=Allomyces macrogynus (strain ATCC 38327) TaxID=578462 RepID=A0A0L0T3Q7_ALLM3|nr:hypothetical protein AMAG_13586 [Allomyces macrogynus ATCC 38327]|eukprot:KNE69194.1 hypothetical protein AMAG_13586 [Allomyces macrogynus ATCC 38327]
MLSAGPSTPARAGTAPGTPQPGSVAGTPARVPGTPTAHVATPAAKLGTPASRLATPAAKVATPVSKLVTPAAVAAVEQYGVDEVEVDESSEFDAADSAAVPQTPATRFLPKHMAARAQAGGISSPTDNLMSPASKQLAGGPRKKPIVRDLSPLFAKAKLNDKENADDETSTSSSDQPNLVPAALPGKQAARPLASGLNSQPSRSRLAQSSVTAESDEE